MRDAPLWHGNLFVSNLPKTTDVAHFKEFFAYWGCHGIDKVSFNRGKRTALVKFQSIWEAQWAMRTMDLRHYGATATVTRPIIVRLVRGRCGVQVPLHCRTAALPSSVQVPVHGAPLHHRKSRVALDLLCPLIFSSL